jgi:hypothetical protein
MKTKKVLSRHRNSKNTKKRIIKSSSNSKSSINSKSNKKSIKRTNITRKRGYIGKGGDAEESRYVPPHKRNKGSVEGSRYVPPPMIKEGGVEGNKYIPPHMRNKGSVEGNEQSELQKTQRSAPTENLRKRHYIGSTKFINTKNRKNYQITANKLDVTILQYLVDKNKIEVKDGKLIIKDYPNIVINEQDAPEKRILTKTFYDVYEGGDDIIPNREDFKQMLLNNKFEIPTKKVDNDKVYNITQDVSYLNNLIDEIKNEKYYCNLKYKEYNIIETLKIDGKDYYIVGFPSVKHMVNFLSNTELMEYYKTTLAQKHKDNYTEWIVELYNKIFPDDKIENANENYKLLLPFLEHELPYLKNLFALEEVFNDKDNKIYNRVSNKINENLAEKVKTVFARPNIPIRYTFHIFVKEGDNWAPMIYSIRELKKEHKPLLEKTLKLIQTKIPPLFNLQDGETNFYSYYEHGSIFSIETEYLHPTNRTDTFSHFYQRRITLEELIYSSALFKDGTNVPFWSVVKFEYPIKNYRLSEKTTNIKGGSATNNNFTENVDLTNAEIILYNPSVTFHSEIFYKKDGKLYYMKIETNMSDVKNTDAINNLEESEPIYDCEKKIYLANHASSYKVLEHREMLQTDNIYKKWGFPVIRFTSLSYDTINKMINDVISDNQSKNIKTWENINISRKNFKIEDYYGFIPYTILIAGILHNKINPINISDIPEPFKPFVNTVGLNKIKTEINNIIQTKYSKDNNYFGVYQKLNNKPLLWLYKTDNNDTPVIGSNKLRSLHYIVENDIKYITEIVKGLKIDAKTLFINKFIVSSMESMHLQVLESEKYRSPLYKTDLTTTTEIRLFKFNNVSNIIQNISTYYKDLKNNTSIITPYFLSTL